MKPLVPHLPTPDDPLAFLRACHRRIEERLGSLEAAVAAFREPGHPRWEEATEAVLGAARYFEEAAARHHEDEEASLFPRLGARDPEVAAVLGKLAAEHREGDALRHRLSLVARALVDPDETPRAVGELPAVVQALVVHYRGHIRVEEDEVFPRAARALTPEEVRTIGREMQERRRR